MIKLFSKGTEIYCRGGSEKGIATGAQHKCRLNGCRGMRITVRWPDGKYTHPCSEGIIAKPFDRVLGFGHGHERRWAIR